MRSVAFSKESVRTLRKLPRRDVEYIRQKIEQLADNPDSLANTVSKLAGHPYFRMRVGRWRVIFDDDGLILTILAVRVRNEKTYRDL